MPAYVIAEVSINDPEQYKKYTAVTPGIIKKYGGKFVVRGGDVQTLEGEHEIRDGWCWNLQTRKRLKIFMTLLNIRRESNQTECFRRQVRFIKRLRAHLT